MNNKSYNKPPQLSLVLTAWSKPWLLEKALDSLARQTLDPDRWELIITDDCSIQPVLPVIEAFAQAHPDLQIRYVPLSHTQGWRGISAALKIGYTLARAPMLAQTNGHLLLPPDSLYLLLNAHSNRIIQRDYCEAETAELLGPKLWVSLRGFTLNTAATKKLESVPWREGIHKLWELPESQDDWTRLWLHNGPEGKKFYGSHLCCSIPKSVFFAIDPWPDGGIGDYGTEDPMYHDARARYGVKDLNIWPEVCMFAHLSHNNWQQDAMELIPGFLNKQAHTQATARIWDHDAFERFTLQDVIDFWESGQQTTDFQVRTAWGWPSAPTRGRYCEFAREHQREGLTYVDELLSVAGHRGLPEELEGRHTS